MSPLPQQGESKSKLFPAFIELLSGLSDDANYERNDVMLSNLSNYVAFIGYTVLVWDHVISFGDEVRFIWMRKKKLNDYLFFLNRYFTPLAFIGNFIAYFSHWSEETCRHFVRYEGSCTIIAVEVTSLMLLMRVKALYMGKNMIIGSVVLLLGLETAVNAWLMTTAGPVPHNGTSVKACTMVFDPRLHFWPSLSAWLPLLYDTSVIVLTLYACMPRVKQSTASHIVQTLMRDGLIYYSVICCINFVLAIMIVSAGEAIKNIAAQLQQMISVAMISRITLSLRREGAKRQYDFKTEDDNKLDDCFVWSVAPGRPDFVGSETAHHHISVVPASDCTSLRSARQEEEVVRPASAVVGGGYKRGFNQVHGGRRISASFGTVSFGVASISPAHSQEAAAAAGLNVPMTAIISEPSQLNERNVYELRMLRPR